MSPSQPEKPEGESKVYRLSRSHADELSLKHRVGTASPSSSELLQNTAPRAMPRSGIAPAPGLSNNHNRRKPSVLLIAGASFLQVETGRRGPCPFENRNGIRGKISYYSSRSAARHRQLLSKVRRSELPHLPCLTYPLVFPDASQPEIYKRHLKVFLQRLRYHHPTIGGTWKLEFQPRRDQEKHQAAHFHLEVWGIKMDRDIIARFGDHAGLKRGIGSYTEFMEWLSRTWYEVVGSGDPKHLAAGTRFERARTVAGSISYASSYSAKPEQTLAGVATGRYWGVFGRENIPFGEPLEKETTHQQAMMVARTARRLVQSRAKSAHFRRMSLATDGKWRQCGLRWEVIRKPLHRRAHGVKGRKVNRVPRIRAAGEFKCIVDADQWVANFARLVDQTPLSQLPTLRGFKPKLP
jgi:hypothetical protein